jgi:hypothetical protein
VICGTTLFSQQLHEVKYNGIFLGSDRIELQYELIPRPRLGLELGLSYDFTTRNIYFVPQTLSSPPDSLVRYSSNRIGATLKYKRYGKKKVDKGFYYGAYLRLDYHLSTDDQYYTDFERLNSRTPYPTDRTLTGLGLGAHLGYKFIFWEKLIIEGAFGSDYDIQDSRRFSGLSFGAILELKLGYRF